MSQREQRGRAAASAGAQERRKHPRTREFGPQKLVVRPISPGATPVQATLWDFSEGGLGMDTCEPLSPGQEVSVSGELHSADYSMSFLALATVAYCRQTSDDSYRVGVAFAEARYRRIAGPPE